MDKQRAVRAAVPFIVFILICSMLFGVSYVAYLGALYWPRATIIIGISLMGIGAYSISYWCEGS